MGSSQSSPEKQKFNAQQHILVVRDPTAWQRLAPQGISPVYLPPLFAQPLVPCFLAILEPFYTGELRRALERCGDFMNQLSAMKYQLGGSYDTTVRCYCIVRLMIQCNMGYYCYPADLPIPNPPHLEPVPPKNTIVSDEYIVHRLLSSMFDTLQRSAAQLQEDGWTSNECNKIVQGNMAFFKRELSRFVVAQNVQHPVSELHVWFWAHYFVYIADRQHYLSFGSSFGNLKGKFIKEHGAPLVVRLATECRPEALMYLAQKWAVHAIAPPDAFATATQHLLDRATTKYQHVMLRLVTTSSAVSLREKGKLDPGLWDHEVRACLDLAEQAQLGAAAAQTTSYLPATLDIVSNNAKRFVTIGFMDGATTEDQRRITILLNQDEAIIRNGGGVAIMEIFKEIFDREIYLWGGTKPRNSHKSKLVTYVHNWCDEFVIMDSAPLATISLLACCAMAVYQLCLKAGRAAEWDIGQSMLFKAHQLLNNYYLAMYANSTPPRLIVKLLRDIAMLGIQDHYHVPAWRSGGGTPAFYKAYSAWVSWYAFWAPTYERWGDPLTLGQRLDAVQAFLQKEIQRDEQRKDYVNLVRKYAAATEIKMYHPGADMRGGLSTSNGYVGALQILEDENIWLGKRDELANVATFVRRIEGIWSAWQRDSGQRIPLGEPDPRDFWTRNFVQLGLYPHHANDMQIRSIMYEKHIEAEIAAGPLELVYGDYLEQCVRDSQRIFSMN